MLELRDTRPGSPRPDPAPPSPRSSRKADRQHGQSLAEFALVVPIMLFLVVAIGDFGRIFAYGVALEGAARSAAEVVSSEYLAGPPGALDAAPAPAAGYYTALHDAAARAVCADSREMPGVTLDAGTGTCPGMPLVMVCVHDGTDDRCGTEANGATIPAECGEMQVAPTNVQADGTRRYVEVRTCYRFDAFISTPLVSFGTFWLQRTRVFDIPCYYHLGPAECG